MHDENIEDLDADHDGQAEREREWRRDREIGELLAEREVRLKNIERYGIEEEDSVRINGRSGKHRVLKISGTKSSALITWGDNDYTWWPLGELELVAKGQQELF